MKAYPKHTTLMIPALEICMNLPIPKTKGADRMLKTQLNCVCYVTPSDLKEINILTRPLWMHIQDRLLIELKVICQK